jgi:hypothetical protein
MPSLSTIKRGFGILEPEEFSTRFIEWMKESLQLPDKDVVSVGGGTKFGDRQTNGIQHTQKRNQSSSQKE